MSERGEATMADVATVAGVSIATVSRALSGAAGVGEATRERVRRVAEDLSYVVSPEASGLSRRVTGRVGVVVPRLNTWFYATMFAAISKELRTAGLDVLVYQVDGPEERRQFFAELPARRKVDAVVLTALPLEAREAERLGDMKVHVVVAGSQILDYPNIRIDDVGAGRTAVDHLIGHGHERIAMVTATDPSLLYVSAVQNRIDGYRAGMDAAGLHARDDYLVRLPYGVDAGRDGTRLLLELDEPPTAVITYSDEMAFGARRCLEQASLRVPEDVSLMSFDGHPMAELFGISTVDQHVEAQGRAAAGSALDLLAGRPCRREVIIDTELVPRESTGPPTADAHPTGRW